MAEIKPERVDFEEIEAVYGPPPSPDATEAERGLWYAMAQVTALMRLEEEVALMRRNEEKPRPGDETGRG